MEHFSPALFCFLYELKENNTREWVARTLLEPDSAEAHVAKSKRPSWRGFAAIAPLRFHCAFRRESLLQGA